MAHEYFPVPLAGFFAAGEIGQVSGATFLHGFTSVVGLVRPRVMGQRPAAAREEEQGGQQ